MNILFLKKFNNYANRIVVKYSTLTEYQQRAASYITFTDINFNPNDGVTTELVVGNESQQQPAANNTTTTLDWDTNGSPDYLVCFEGSGTIISRWFIMECLRTRKGQFKLVLKRDSIADHISDVIGATCFINKGKLNDSEDPAIYNKEPISTNQIKSDEYLIKDETQCGWIVGYVAKDRDDGSGHLTPVSFTEQTIDGPQASDSACSEVYTDETEFYAAHPDLVNELSSLNSWEASVKLDVWYLKLWSTYMVGQTVSCDNNGNVNWKESTYENKQYLYSRWQEGRTQIWKSWVNGDFRKGLSNSLVENWKTDTFKSNLLAQIEAKENTKFVSESTLQEFFNFVKRQPVIKIGSKYYIPYDRYGDSGTQSTVNNSIYASVGSTAFNLLYSNLNLRPHESWNADTDIIDGLPGPTTFNVTWSYNRHALGLREIFSECKAKIPATVPTLKDAPYHMFAIPFSDDLALYSGNTLHCVTNKSVAMNAAQALAQQTGAGVIYDVQLLPYCPIRDIIKTDKIAGHAEFPVAEENVRSIAYEGPGGTSFYLKNNYFKLNTQYILSKDIQWTVVNSLDSWNQYAFALKSDGIIYVKVGNNDIENPDDTYQCKRIEVIKPNNDISEDAKIRLYSTKEIGQNTELLAELSYNDYVSGITVIGIYLTSDFSQGGYGENISHVVGWEWLSNTAVPLGTLALGRRSNPRVWTTGYLYYEDYYLSKIDIANAITSDIVTIVNNAETDIVNTIFWCTDSQFSFNKYLDNYFLLQADGTYKSDIVTDLINEKVKLPWLIDDIKVANQANMIRLAAPNYSNFFDINVVQNRGIEYINIDCTYKPYQPYMHLNPNFKGLYGADYNDVRGLICGGDYSIATTTDAWATYQLQNKNYQAIFDRQIQQLETQHGIQRETSILKAVGAVGGATTGGAMSGAMTGAKFGGGYGAIAGAIIGAGAGLAGSTLGSSIAITNADRLRELQVSTMKDIHYLQLDNIKALPLGLAKTSYLTNNNKLFPFLEFYTCTPVEEMAIRDYMNYNGMTIDRIGQIRDFQSGNELPYIKAQLIRIDLQDDPHQVNAISDELALGVYLPEETSDVVNDDSD